MRATEGKNLSVKYLNNNIGQYIKPNTWEKDGPPFESVYQ